MRTYLACWTGLLAALILAKPVSCEEVEKPAAPPPSLCVFVRSAADQTQLEVEAGARLRATEKFSGQEFDGQPRIPFEAPSHRESPARRPDRILFESFLVNWLFFEDLAREQQAIMQKFLVRCGVAADRLSLAASIFGQFHTSLRATFVGITQAMMNTLLTDQGNGQRLGDALGLIQELIDIQGENSALPSDQQFQLIVRLAPDALEKLDRAAFFFERREPCLPQGLSDLLPTVSPDRSSRTGSRSALLLNSRCAFRSNSYRLPVWAVALGSREFGRARGRQPPAACRPLARMHLVRKSHPRSACGTRPAEFRAEPRLGGKRLTSSPA